MRRRLLGGLLALTLLPATPTPARAGCLTEAIASCNADFPSSSEQLAGVRGWCYMIRAAMCALMDE